MKTEAKSEAEVLMNDGITFAQRMLREHGEFHPFARALDAGGNIRSVAAFDGREFPPGSEALEYLESALRIAVREEGHVAVAVLSNVTVKDQRSGEALDAVRVGLEHHSGYVVDVYFPYQLVAGEVAFGDLFAGPRVPTIYVTQES